MICILNSCALIITGLRAISYGMEFGSRFLYFCSLLWCCSIAGWDCRKACTPEVRLRLLTPGSPIICRSPTVMAISEGTVFAGKAFFTSQIAARTGFLHLQMTGLRYCSTGICFSVPHWFASIEMSPSARACTRSKSAISR